MPVSLVESQLATLEPPSANEGVLIRVPLSIMMTPVAAVASFVYTCIQSYLYMHPQV